MITEPKAIMLTGDQIADSCAPTDAALPAGADRSTDMDLGHQDQSASIVAIRKSLAAGEDSGEPRPFNLEEFKNKMQAASAKAVRRRATTQR